MIEALGNFMITKQDEFLVIAKPGTSKVEQNLCLDGLLPLVAGYYNGRLMQFSFDSGAESSMFYLPFFKADEKNIAKIADAKKITVAGGRTNFAKAQSPGKRTMLSNWQARFSDIDGRPQTFDAQFSCIRGARVLWIKGVPFCRVDCPQSPYKAV